MGHSEFRVSNIGRILGQELGRIDEFCCNQNKDAPNTPPECMRVVGGHAA